MRLASQQLGAGGKLSGSRKLDSGSDPSPAPQWSTGTSTGWSRWGWPQTTCPTCQHRSALATRPRTTGSGTWNPTAHPLASDPNPATRLQSDKDCPSVGTLHLSLDVRPRLGIGALVSQGKGVTGWRSRAGSLLPSASRARQTAGARPPCKQLFIRCQQRPGDPSCARGEVGLGLSLVQPQGPKTFTSFPCATWGTPSHPLELGLGTPKPMRTHRPLDTRGPS